MESLMADTEKRMKSALEVVNRDLQSIRTGRAHPSLLENIVADVYGSKMPINQVASVSVVDSRLLQVSVWDQSNTSAVEKAIKISNLGLNPVAEGTLIRVPLPTLTMERRKELSKSASAYAEKGRVAVRNIRRDTLDQMKKKEKQSEISEDELRTTSESVQKLTDKYIADIDSAFKKKEADLQEV